MRFIVHGHVGTWLAMSAAKRGVDTGKVASIWSKCIGIKTNQENVPRAVLAVITAETMTRRHPF